MEVPQKTKNRVATWSGNPTPGRISGKDENSSWKGYITPVFTAALFTIAKTWKQPKCPSTDEWIKRIWYKKIQWDITQPQKGWNNAIGSNMDEPRDDHTQWSRSDRERQMSYDFPYMWNLKKWYKWTCLQNRNRLTDIENRLMVSREESWGRDKLGIWD